MNKTNRSINKEDRKSQAMRLEKALKNMKSAARIRSFIEKYDEGKL